LYFNQITGTVDEQYVCYKYNNNNNNNNNNNYHRRHRREISGAHGNEYEDDSLLG
jgi:hypothetical protein